MLKKVHIWPCPWPSHITSDRLIVFIPPPGFMTPTVGLSCATHLLNCSEQSRLDVPDILSGPISYTCRRAHMQVEDLWKSLLVWGSLSFQTLRWWVNLHLDFGGTSILMLHIRSWCCRATSSPGITFTSVTSVSTEKDEVYLCGHVSQLVRDEMAVTYLETCCSQEAGQMLGHSLGFSRHLVPACLIWSHHALPCIQYLQGLHSHSNLHMGSEILMLGSWQSQHAADQRTKQNDSRKHFIVLVFYGQVNPLGSVKTLGAVSLLTTLILGMLPVHIILPETDNCHQENMPI